MSQNNKVETVEQVVLEDLTNRERIHKNLPINLARLYQRITTDRYVVNKDGIPHKTYSAKKIDKKEFYQFFRLLEELNLGKIIKGPRGGIRDFKSNVPINELKNHLIKEPSSESIEALDRLPLAKVVVLFDVKGRRCRAEVPQEILEDFEKLVGL